MLGNYYPGLEYDPVGDRFVAWGENSRNTVYFLNLDSRTWTSTTYAGGPNPSRQRHLWTIPVFA